MAHYLWLLTASRCRSILAKRQEWGRSDVKIHAFRIVPRGALALDQVLSHINDLPLEDRLRTVAGGDIRLEMGNRAGRFWMLDFGGIRPDGPGRASAEAPIIDFDLNDNEGFGQETAALFDTQSNFMIIQYNHFGPRSGRIQGYLFRFSRKVSGLTEDIPETDDHGFTLAAVLKRDAIDRLNRASVVRNIDVKVFVPGIRNAELAKRQSISKLLEHPIFGNVQDFHLRLTAPRKRGESLNIAAIKQMAAELVGLGDDVSALQMTVREVEEGPSEPLDLLDARLELDLHVERAGRRLGRNERWAALRQALDTWTNEHQFK